VTGGAGFIGSHLVDRLVREGANVTVLDDLSTGSRSNLNPAVAFQHASITDTQAVRDSLRSVSVVFHLAADATTRESSMGWQTPVLTLECNLMGTLNMLQSIVKLGLKTRMVFASSAAVYGEPLRTPVAEDDPTNPVSPYGISKLAGEKLAFAYLKEYEVDSVVVRIFNTYGPRQARYVIFELLKKLQKDKSRLKVLGSPDTVRDYCYVSDMVDALILAATNGAAGRIYNVSGESPIDMAHLVDLIIMQLGIKGNVEIQFTGHSWNGDIKKMTGDITRIKEIGFQPTISLAGGLRQMLASSWWRSNLHENLRDSVVASSTDP